MRLKDWKEGLINTWVVTIDHQNDTHPNSLQRPKYTCFLRKVLWAMQSGTQKNKTKQTKKTNSRKTLSIWSSSPKVEDSLWDHAPHVTSILKPTQLRRFLQWPYFQQLNTAIGAGHSSGRWKKIEKPSRAKRHNFLFFKMSVLLIHVRS